MAGCPTVLVDGTMRCCKPSPVEMFSPRKISEFFWDSRPLLLALLLEALESMIDGRSGG